MNNNIIRIPAILETPRTSRFFSSHPIKSSQELNRRLTKDTTIYNSMKYEIINQYFPDFMRTANYQFDNKQKPNQIPLVSYIIPLKCPMEQRRENFLEKVLHNIKSQNFPLEIIVVEQDGDIAKFLCQKLQIKYYNVFLKGPFNKGKCFNYGASKATTNKLIFHDADLLVPPDYSSRISTILDSFDCCHVGRRVYQLNEAHSANFCFGVKKIECQRIILIFEGGSIASTKKHFCSVGGGCEEFSGYGFEDAELYERLSLNQKAYLEKEIDFVHLFHAHDNNMQEELRNNHNTLKRLRSLPMNERYRICKENLKRFYPDLFA